MGAFQSDLKKYLDMVIKRKLIFVISFLVIVTASVIISYSMPNAYEAQSTVYIERNFIGFLVKGIASTPSLDDRLKVLNYAMTSRHLILKVIEELDLNANKKSDGEVEKTIKEFQDKTVLKIKQAGGSTNLFTVSYQNPNPKLARDYVNALIRKYIEENTSEKREETFGANTFLSEQIGTFKEKLDKLNEQITAMQKNKGAYSVADESTALSDVRIMQDKLQELKIRKDQLESAKEQMKNPQQSSSGELALLQKRLSDLLTQYTENYPEVIRVKTEIEALKNQASDPSPRQGYSPELAKIEMELSAIKTSENYYNKQIANRKAILGSIPSARTEVQDLERERDLVKITYEQLSSRLNQTEVSKQLEVQDKSTSFRIIDPAVLPIKPASPDRVMIILLGFTAGLAGGLGVVLLADFMDDSIKTIYDLRTIGVPLLAKIPGIENPEELLRKKRKDITLYKYAGVYMLLILGIFVMELVGIPVFKGSFDQSLISDFIMTVKNKLIHTI